MIALPRLSPRRMRLVLTLLTGAVVVSIAFAIAGLTWRIAGHAGTGAITVPAPKRGGATAGAGDLATALAFTPFGKPVAGQAGQATTLPLALKGVFAAGKGSASTAWISVSGAPAQAFHPGDSVNGAQIDTILPDRVILLNAGRSEYLAFPDPTQSVEQRAQAGQPAAPGQPGNATPPASAPAAAAAASPAGMLQRFDAQPVDGGYRIGDNGPPGLLPGDVLQSVNGTPLSDPQAAAGAMAAAQASGSAQIQILRDGKRLTLTVPLR
ncbi:MAG: type II secretion system protein N [Pseudomonadota bacterium]